MTNAQNVKFDLKIVSLDNNRQKGLAFALTSFQSRHSYVTENDKAQG